MGWMGGLGQFRWGWVMGWIDGLGQLRWGYRTSFLEPHIGLIVTTERLVEGEFSSFTTILGGSGIVILK